MANYLSPFSSRQFLDANGNPYSGAKLFTYTVLSSTKVTTYKNEAGSAAHANPIILNTKGEPADSSGVAYPVWQIGGTAVKYVLAPSGDTDPPASPIETWDNIDGINDTSITLDQWSTGPTPTYISATSFSLVGDQTSNAHVGRRIKTTNSGGTIYSTITATAYTTQTTVTVVNDSGTLDSGLSALSYGLVTSTNSSIPAVITAGISWKHQGSVWLTEGAAVASAADCNIWSAGDGNTVHVTGTTTITDWGTAPQAGATMYVIFDGAVPLTYSATTNKLNTNGANYTTQSGDRAIIYAETIAEYVVTIIPVNTNPYTLSGAAVALAATGTSDSSVASTAFVQQEIGSTTTIRGTHLFGIEAQAQNTTYYIGENGLVGGGSQSASTTESDMIWWPILPVTLRDLYISANTTPAAGQTATVTLMKNGVATSMTAQITSAGGVVSDTANTVSAGPGDYLSFRSVLSATSGTLSLSCSMRFTDPGSAKGISLIPFNYLSDAAAARVNGGLCLAGLGATEPARYPVVHDKCNIASYYEQTTSTGTVGPDIKIASTARMFAKQTTPYVLGATNTELSAVAAPSVPLTQYSHCLISNPTDGAAVRRRGSWSMQQRTSGFSPNQIKPLYLTSRSQAQNTTLFMGGHLCAGHATEATKQFPVTAGVLKNFILLNESAGVNAQTWTANVRVNGVQVLQLVLTMSGAATDQYVADITSTLTVVNGDLVSVQLVSSATTGTCSLQFACDHTVA